jgi:outer membrane protein assembly factor BamB
MNQSMSLERMLAELMADEASGGAPDQLIDQIRSTTSRSRPLPRWLAVLREPSMLARSRVAVGMSTRQLVLIGALLLLGAIVAIGAAALLLQKASPPAETWPGYRGDASRGGTAVSGPIGNPIVRWQFHAGGAIAADIGVAGDLVIAPSDDGKLHALDLTTGSERWTFSAAAPMRGPFVADGRVYVADGDGVVHAVRLADGTPVWAATERLGTPSDLAVVGDRLVVGTQDGTVLGLNTGDGTVAWRTSVGSSPIHAPSATAGGIAIATDALDLAVLDPATGAIRWRINAGVDRSGTPVIVGDTVYIGATADSQAGRLSAHDLATGTERWRVDKNIYTPSVSGGIGYTGSAVGRVTAFDLATGAELWVAQFDGAARAPAVTETVVFVAADRERRVVALDKATGGELWSLPVDGNMQCCIAAARGLVFVGTLTGSVYAIGGDGATLTAKGRPSLAPSASPSATATPAASASPSAGASLLPARLSWTATSGTGFNPWGLAQAPNGDLWASLARENRFAIFTQDGRFIETWGSGGTGNGEFDLRRANGDEYGMLAFAPDGSFFVLDVGNRRVQAFDAKRTFLRAWGSFGSEPGRFLDPVSIAVDADGNVNVLDDVRQVIEVFSPRGKVVRTVPAFPAQVRPNEGANQLQVGPSGHFFVSVVFPNLIAELDRDGSLVRTYGDGTKGFSFTEQPNRVAFDAAGRMYVTQGPQRSGPGVAIFSPDGTYLGGFGALGTGPAEMTFPWGLVVTKDGIYVTDAEAPAEVALKKFEPVQLP